MVCRPVSEQCATQHKIQNMHTATPPSGAAHLSPLVCQVASSPSFQRGTMSRQREMMAPCSCWRKMPTVACGCGPKSCGSGCEVVSEKEPQWAPGPGPCKERTCAPWAQDLFSFRLLGVARGHSVVQRAATLVWQETCVEPARGLSVNEKPWTFLSSGARLLGREEQARGRNL